MRSVHLWSFAAVSTLMAMVAQSAIAEEKASPELQKVTVRDGVELHYVELGDGVPVIFIHGGLHDYSAWNDHLDVFARKYRTIAYSRRYSSPNNNKLRPNHSAVVDAEDLAAFLRKLNISEKVHVVGHSYGAYTGLFLAIKHPEMVRTLTLCEPPVLSWLADLPGVDSERGKAIMADSVKEVWTPAKLAFGRDDPHTALRVFVDKILGEGTYDNLPQAVRDRAYRNRRTLESLAISANRYPRVRRKSVRGLKVPTLLLYSENAHPAAQLIGAELRRLVPDKLQVWVSVPGTTHAMWHQEPAKCRQAVLEFLAGK